MWEALSLIFQGTEKIKENKFVVLMQGFESFTMKPNESIDMFETSALNMITKLCSFGKNLTLKEINLKIVRALMRK